MAQKDQNLNELNMPMELIGYFGGAIWKQLASFPLLRYQPTAIPKTLASYGSSMIRFSKEFPFLGKTKDNPYLSLLSLLGAELSFKV